MNDDNDDLLGGGEGEPMPAVPGTETRGRGAATPVRAGVRSAVRTAPPTTERLVRQRNQHADKFHVSEAAIPDGMTYEWKRVSVLGAADHYYENSLAEQHWKPVPAARHPNLVPPDHNGTIVREGLMLMERPSYLTQDARDEELAAARERIQVQQKRAAATPEGTMTRDHPSARPLARRSYEAMPIPNE